MKQILQDLRGGQTRLVEVPSPIVTPGSLLIRTTRTLISAGTERMLVEFGKASLLAKARSQPDKVKQVLDKIKTDGLSATLEAVFSRLDEPLPLGYCNCGVVLEVGPGVTGFASGDRVISNGPHAQIVAVPKNLCAKVPDGISDEQAAFTVLASIALQGLRLVNPLMGEQVAVFGLGVIGLVAVQLLRANGCQVLAIDVNADRLRQAAAYGAATALAGQGTDPVVAARAWTSGRGVDAVVITAAAKTDLIMHQAAEMSRKRGRLVLVGVVGLNIRRSDFYEKELTFQVSCSYGPGRYDDRYEKGGQDYPLSQVRWTEQRNFQAVLDMLATGRLNVEALISHRFNLDEAAEAYDLISTRGGLGVILKYPEAVDRAPALTLGWRDRDDRAVASPIVGVIGAGNFSKVTLVPALAKIGARVGYIADLNTAAATHLAGKFQANKAVSDYHLMLQDPAVQAVFVAVNHNLHARLVTEILRAGKHAFVEKPLAMTLEELSQIQSAAAAAPQCMVMTGFNRRFSPHTQAIAKALSGRKEPVSMTMTVNAGYIPPEHWVHDPVLGGGRIIGEACHFIDLLAFLAGCEVTTVSACMAGRGFATRDDKMAITLGFADGSVGSVCYYANGSKQYPKELLRVFSDGRVFELDNFRQTHAFGARGFRTVRTRRQDKGHQEEFAQFIAQAAQGREPPVRWRDQVAVTLASFAAVASAMEERTVILEAEYPEILQRAVATA
ncbi:MAG: bi-domain-containing oxidoreductase [Planctomycetaceae bacterium]|nr:bi-domain-containing oxidoreductase [Planctomycetaceae bacterium]